MVNTLYLLITKRNNKSYDLTNFMATILLKLRITGRINKIFLMIVVKTRISSYL